MAIGKIKVLCYLYTNILLCKYSILNVILPDNIYNRRPISVCYAIISYTNIILDKILINYLIRCNSIYNRRFYNISYAIIQYCKKHFKSKIQFYGQNRNFATKKHILRLFRLICGATRFYALLHLNTVSRTLRRLRYGAKL